MHRNQVGGWQRHTWFRRLAAATATLGIVAAYSTGGAIPAAEGAVAAMAAALPGGTFLSESCVSSSACMAVGDGSLPGSGGGVQALSEWWNGTRWTVEKTPDPAGSIETQVLGVSCSAADACILVGNYDDVDEDQLLFAEVWNGSTWTITTTPLPKSAADPSASSLNAVSCSRSNFCVAVGTYRSSSLADEALIETWTGSWTITANPAPVNATLDGVSCPSPDACTTVGTYANATVSKYFSLAETFAGTGWKLQPTPNASNAEQTAFQSVSCTSSSACVAVGEVETSVSTMAVATWNGHAWRLAKVAPPAGSTTSALAGVSCDAPKSCTAVGGYSKSGGFEYTLVEVWNGTSLKRVASPNPARSVEAALESVSCKTSTWCQAAGSYATASSGAVLAENWRGRSWSLADPPSTTPPTGAVRL